MAYAVDASRDELARGRSHGRDSGAGLWLAAQPGRHHQRQRRLDGCVLLVGHGRRLCRRLRRPPLARRHDDRRPAVHPGGGPRGLLHITAPGHAGLLLPPTFSHLPIQGQGCGVIRVQG